MNCFVALAQQDKEKIEKHGKILINALKENK
jgi:hypothetical protein